MVPIRQLAVCLALVLLSCGPRPSDVVLHEAIAAQEAGRQREAERLYRKVLASDPAAPGAANNLAVIELDKGRVTAAVARLEDELARNPGLIEARLNRALALIDLGDYERAATDIEPFVREDQAPPPHERPEALRLWRQARLLHALSRLGREQPPEEVEAELREVLEHGTPEGAADDGLTPLIRRLLLVTAMAGERWDVASERLDAAAGDPALRAAVLTRLGRDQEALDALGEVAPPDDPAQAARLRVGRAHLLARVGRYDEAAAELAPLLATDEKKGEAKGEGEGDAEPPAAGLPATLARATWWLDASLASREGAWQRSLESLDRALAAGDGSSTDLWLDRAVVLVRLGRLDEARRAVAGVLRDAPDDARAGKMAALLE